MSRLEPLGKPALITFIIGHLSSWTALIFNSTLLGVLWFIIHNMIPLLTLLHFGTPPSMFYDFLSLAARVILSAIPNPKRCN